MQNSAQDKHRNDDLVSLSNKGQTVGKSAGASMATVGLDTFGGPPSMLAPLGAGAVEEFAYRREGIPLDTSTTPPQFSDTGNPLNFQEWLAKEKEIDKFVEQRVEIYNSSKAAGVSDQEILKRLTDFNATVPKEYSGIGQPYGSDFKVDYNVDSSTLLANLDNQRRSTYKMMSNYLAHS